MKKIVLCCLACFTAFLVFYFSDRISKVEIYFSTAKIPCIELHVNDKPVWVRIDLGSSTLLSLNENIIQKWNLEKQGEKLTHDAFNNQYYQPIYPLGNLRLSRLLIKQGTLHGSPTTFEENIALEYSVNTPLSKKEIVGRLGVPILNHTYLFFDFPNSHLYACKSKWQFWRCLSKMKKYQKIHFSNIQGMIVLDVETDFGCTKLLLDTGSTITFIKRKDQKKFRPINTQLFQIGGKDFGPFTLNELDIDLDMISPEITGALGMDFLRKHSFAIDYYQNCIYLQEEGSFFN